MTSVVLAALIAAAATPTPAPVVPSMAPASPAVTGQPFAPPAGWTPMPSYFLVSPVSWEDSATHRDSIMLMRMPATVAALPPAQLDRLFGATLPALLHAAEHSTGVHMHVTSAAIRICGEPAHVITFGFGGTPLGEVFVETAPSPVMIVYHHAGRATEEHFLRTFCPSARADLASIAPPPGWQNKPQMHPISEWYGPVAGAMLVELQGPAMPTLAGAAALSVVRSTWPRTAITQTCGAPAIETDSTRVTGSLRMHVDSLFVQGAMASYGLIYTTSQPTLDPAVVAAMHAFCP